MKNKDKRIYTIATAHLDTCWLWTYEKTISAFIPATLKENFILLKKFPEYKFNFEGSHRYELMQEYYPEDFEKLKGYVKEGRWHPCGSCYENGDVNTPSPEALMRNIIYGNGYFRKNFGVESNDIFLPDCFGFGKALPSIAAHAGLTGFSTQKLTWGGSVDVPFDIGFWKGKDGNGLWCALKPGDYPTIAKDVRKNEKYLANLSENTEKYGNPKTFVYHGTGDRGGGPAKASVRNIVKSIKQNAQNDIKVLSATTKEFFDDMENLSQEEKSRLPVYEGELLLTEHGAGSYTSRTVTKRWNRRCELLADAAERFSVGALTQGVGRYPQDNFDKAWKKVIAHQFHDDITGTSFEECYKRSHNDYVQAMNTFSEEYTASMKALSTKIDTSFAKGTPVVVSNPVQNKNKRVQAVSADIICVEALPYARAYDKDGKEVPCQKTDLQNGKVRVTFLAEVPSCGIAVYDVRFSTEKSPVDTELKISGNIIENKNLIVKIDEKGDIASVFNKKTNTEALKESLRMAVLHDLDSYDWPAWEVKLSDMSRKAYMYPERPVITIEEDGPALCKIKIERKAGKSVFVQKISLDAESSYVEVENEVDWREEASMLKAEFRAVASNPDAQYDIGFGYTERGNNQPRLFEVPAQKWAGITDTENNSGIAVFSDSRTGWDKPDDNTIRLTCIHTPLNNYRWECSQHLMDMGLNRFGFAIYPHSGETEKIMAYADEFCQGMHTFVTEKHKGELSDYSVLRINSDSVRVSALKKAQDSDRIIVRVCEYIGKEAKDVEIEFPKAVKEIYTITGDEKETGTLEAIGGKLCFDMKANEIRSFAVVLEDEKAFESTDKALALPYNVVAATSNSERRATTIPGGISIPKELMPEKILTSGAEYKLSEDKMNGLLCKGQKLKIESGYAVASFILTSLKGDRDVTFKAGDKEITVRVQDCFEAVGQWDLMAARQTGYIKNSPQVLSFTHSHNKKGDMIAKQMYFFKADIPIADCGEITLPTDENILILSATLVKDDVLFLKGDEHFDRLAKRKFDYTFSDYALKASKPWKIETIIDKFVDRTYSFKFQVFGMYSKVTLAELYYVLRKSPVKTKCDARKKEILGDFNK